jgi:cysteine-rich repeat protein
MLENDRTVAAWPHAYLAVALGLLSASACATFDAPVGDGSTGSSEGSSEQASDAATSASQVTAAVDGSASSSSTDLPPDADSTTAEPAVCGNGSLEEGEACDDGVNDGSYGGCAPDCSSLAPRCGDGSVDAQEACDDADRDSTDGCLSDCSVPASCMDVLLHDPAAASGIHEIDSDGPGGYGAYDAHCDMEHAGGGWTLVIVSADDGHTTWTGQSRELLTTDTFLVGNVAVLEEDYKSAALHVVRFSDLLFVHEPSGVWASYEGVGDGTSDVGTFMSGLPFPQCDLDSGYPMTDGELTQIGTSLCSTDLYFHAGDYDGSYANEAYCEAFSGASSATATHGPSWSAAGNGGCPLDDPDGSSLGPSILGSYEVYPPEGIEDVEWDGRGFANGMGLMQPADRLEMYVR